MSWGPNAVYMEHRDKYHVPGAKSSAERDAHICRAAEALRKCDALVITAGAGMGVDSGLPDYRSGKTGLWKDKDIPMTYEDLSDDKWFQEEPLLAWGSNYLRIDLYRKTRPHAGFDDLLKIAFLLKKPCFVFTSNVDGHFQKAGFLEESVVACHGEITNLQCTDRNCRGKSSEDDVWTADCIPSGLSELIDASTIRFKEAAPLEAPYFRCARCGKLTRPNCWFIRDKNYVPRKSSLKKGDVYNQWRWALQETGSNVVVIECGGGLAIPSIRVEGEDIVDGCGAESLLVRFNPSASDCRVPAEKAVGLPLGSRDGIRRLVTQLERDLRRSTSPARGRVAPKGKAKSAPCRTASRVRGPFDHCTQVREQHAAKTQAQAESKSAPAPEPPVLEREISDSVAQCFKQLDLTGSGKVSRADLVEVLEILDPGRFNSAALTDIVGGADSLIDYRQVVDWVYGLSA